MNKIGIFGGTFNPVHNAHISIAEEFIEKLSLDMLYVIPNNIPPMKDTESISGDDRIKMLEIAFSENSKVVVSDMELRREGTSYTRDTIAELRRIHPEDKLFLLTGDDWIDSFHKWKDYRFILDNASLVVANRSGKDISESAKRLEQLSGKPPILLGNEITELSSTQFRKQHNKEAIPEGVYEYIKKRGFYGI